MHPLLLYALITLVVTTVAIGSTKKEVMTSPLRQSVQCQCGKVKLAIDSPSALRIVSYGKDYRGYYNTLNEQAKDKNKNPNAALDNWGGYVILS